MNAEIIVIDPVTAIIKGNCVNNTIADNPCWIQISNDLSYRDLAIETEIARLAKNCALWCRKKIEKLKLEIIQKLWKRLNDNEIQIRPGMLPYIKYLKTAKINNQINYPCFDSNKYILTKPLPHSLRQYQENSIQNLLAIKHGHVELATGTGKATIVFELVRRSGLRCVVIVPYIENMRSTLKMFREHLDPSFIGTFGGGVAKQLHKPITICVGASLDRIRSAKSHPEEWNFFSNEVDMLIFDESHMAAVNTMEHVCHNLLSRIPYRCFLSATQLRANNETKKLYQIIGPCVYDLPIAKAITEGYVNSHRFEIYKNIPCPLDIDESPLQLRRDAFLNNQSICEIIYNRVVHDVSAGKPSLILVSEVSQMQLFAELVNKNKAIKVGYAHSCTNKDRLQEMGLPYLKTGSKMIDETIQDFNSGRIMILIGTGAISTGVSFYPNHSTYNWVGTASEILCVQAPIGRSTRKAESNPNYDKMPPHIKSKTETVIIDFDVSHWMLERHLRKRIEYYKESKTSITFIPFPSTPSLRQ